MGLVELCEAAASLSGKPIGHDWHQRFAKRHPDIKFWWAKRGEAKWGSGLNQSNVNSFYQQLRDVYDTGDVHEDDVYNLDEKGLQEAGGTLWRWVLVSTWQVEPTIDVGESQKMVTVLECIGASGQAPTPLVIHEGAKKDGEWVRSNPCGAQ